MVGTNDLTNKRTIRGRHSTHSLVTRDYADLGTIDGQPGPLFQGYHHAAESPLDDDGFLVTEDVGGLDATGRLFLGDVTFVG